jgi:hypothetical protein
MTASPIRKHYDKLNTRERFAALMAAELRGDAAEAQALFDSAPHQLYSVPNTAPMTRRF